MSDIIQQRIAAALRGDNRTDVRLEDNIVPETAEPPLAATDGMSAIDAMRREQLREAALQRAEQFADEASGRGTASRIALALANLEDV